MAGKGVETILGVVRDPVFGAVVMFGLGGVFVEAFKDVAFRVAPFGVDEARAMIDEVKGRILLTGLRGQPPSDEDALAEAIARAVGLRRAARRPRSRASTSTPSSCCRAARGRSRSTR